MSDSSETNSDAGSVSASSQEDPPEEVVQGLQEDDSGKDESRSQKSAADEPEQASRNGDDDAHESEEGSRADTRNGDAQGQTAWDDFQGYMARDKLPEYNAEGLVTLWNAQNDPSLERIDYMAADFDIVIVHGFKGMRRPPFENPGSGSSRWLYNQGEFGGRRVMSFGYDPSKIQSGVYTHQAIRNVATSLLEDMKVARNEAPEKRSIMFIAHDIGGIIVKEALTVAGLNPRSHGDIFDYTRVLLFYGCPHRAVNVLDMENKMSRFIYGQNQQESPIFPPLVNSIGYLAEAIMTINNLFMDSKQMFRSYIFSMFSDGHSSLIDNVFDEFTGTMGLPFEIRLAGGLEDDRSRIEKHIDRISSLLNANKTSIANERFLLSNASPLTHLENAAPAVHSRPLAWINNEKAYRTWYNQRRPQLLYLNGGLNAQLASLCIFYDLDKLHADKNGQIVLFFTFDRYDIRRRSLGDMLATFLAQIVAHFPTLSSLQSQLELCQADRSWNYKDMLYWFEFSRIVGDIEGVSCVINNFDECEPVSRKAFLDHFRYVSENQEHPWRVLVTSCQPGALLEELSNWPTLDLLSPTPETMRELRTNSYNRSLLTQRPELKVWKTQFEEELELLATLEPDVRELVLGHVSRHEHWPSRRSVNDILGPIEGMTLESVVDKILSNIPDQDIALHALCWILYAVRPPTPWELVTAITVGSKKTGYDEVLATAPSANEIISNLQTWLAGIITVEHNEISTSTHRIREVLMARPSTKSRNSHIWDILEKEAHQTIMRTCLIYLADAKTQENLERLYNDSCHLDYRLATTCDRTTLQDYATRFWVQHLSLASSEYDPTEDLTSFVKSGAVPNWSKAYWVLSNPIARSYEPFESLYPVLAGVGLADKAEKWRNGDEDLSAGLIEACFNGQTQTARQLLSRLKHSEKSLDEALAAICAARGDEATCIKIIEHIEKNYPKFPWEKRGHLVTRTSWLGLNKVLAKLLKVGCPADTEDVRLANPIIPLRLAARANNIEAARLLLENGANPNRLGSRKRTVLHTAASCGHPEMIRLLVRNGADVNIRDEDLISPVYEACLWGNPEAVAALADLKANLNLKAVANQDEPGWSPLASATVDNNVDCVRILLDNGADPETTVDFWGTPLGSAVGRGYLEICQLLLGKGANPNHKSIMPPILVHAVNSTIKDHRLEIVKLLVEKKAALDAKDTDGNTALFWACWSDDPDMPHVIEYLLEHGADVNCRNDDDTVPIHVAATRDDVALLHLLLRKKDINLEALDSSKSTPLMMAVKSERITKILLDKGADPNTRPDDNYPALVHAVRAGQTEAVRLLVQYGAQIDPPDELRDDGKWEPLENAVVQGLEEIIRILGEGGADVNRRFGDGRTLIHKALNYDGLRALLEFRPKLDVKADNGYAPLHDIDAATPVENVKLLVRAGSDINLPDNKNLTPLTFALRYKNEEAARYLLSRKANVHIISPAYGGPLHIACNEGLVDLVKELIDAGADVNHAVPGVTGTPLSSIFVKYGTVESSSEAKSQLMNILLDAGADPKAVGGTLGTVAGAAAMGGESIHLNMLASKGVSFGSGDDMGRRPLHLAAVRGNRDIVSFLLASGVSATAKTKNGRNAVSWAAQGGNIDILNDLLKLSDDGAINEPDVDGWTPLCWATRGVGNTVNHSGGSQYEIVKELLGRGADRSVKSHVRGREYTPASIARYHGADEDVLELLTHEEGTDQLPDGDGPMPSLRSEHFKYNNAYCDFCLFGCYGLKYSCKTCMDFDLCYKCYASKDMIHSPDHDFEEAGPEFIVTVDVRRSRSSSPAPSQSDTSSVSASDSDDASGD
ncbi:ankyrin repeat-containing domain protein [Hypoxylon sp. NC0597]|nr:ankyrin repeat-containing domain protein [Hypoxylon sp. NC0597]